MLRCPNCHAELKREGKAFRCQNGHSFDVARQGYVNLLVNARRETGDNKEMVSARTAFLEQGHYRCLRDALCEIIRSLPVQVIADCGCGEGYYTAGLYQVLEQEGLSPRVGGFDISKFALRRAAKQLPQGEFAVASVHHIPLPDCAADLLVDVFSPLDIGQFRRILKPEGGFFYVVPGARHLWELKEILYDTPYENAEKKVEYPGFRYREILPVDYTMHLKTPQAIQALFQMTPYYWKTPRAGKEALSKVTSLTCRVSFDIHCFTAE